MDPNIISFAAWAIMMLLMLAGIAVAAKRSRNSHEEMEDTASACLPEIGRIAEEKHLARFGRASTDMPVGREDSKHEWYPRARSKVVKHL